MEFRVSIGIDHTDMADRETAKKYLSRDARRAWDILYETNGGVGDALDGKHDIILTLSIMPIAESSAKSEVR